MIIIEGFHAGQKSLSGIPAFLLTLHSRYKYRRGRHCLSSFHVDEICTSQALGPMISAKLLSSKIAGLDPELEAIIISRQEKAVSKKNR